MFWPIPGDVERSKNEPMAEDDDPIRFPDAPRAALDRTLNDLVERAHQVLETQGRLRALLRADQAVLAELDLPVMLRRIIDAAVELTGAEYGALGVLAPRGGLEEFIYVGMTAEQAEKIGHLPEGHGLLGALIHDPRPIRLERLEDDPRSVGFPAHHPPMEGFLGVPIRVGGEVFGNLYLTSTNAEAFTADDEELVVSLAATAGLAINNARLYSQTRRRQDWIAATSELIASVASGDTPDPLHLVARGLATLSEAQRHFVLRRVSSSSGRSGHAPWSVTTVPDDSKTSPSGDFASLELTQAELDNAAASQGSVLLSPAASAGESLGDPSAAIGSTIAVPIRGSAGVDALIVLTRPGVSAAFNAFDLDLIDIVARQSSLALQLAAARADRQRMELLDDRARIARDLHDLVIQQIYAAGLELQTVIGMENDPAIVDRVSRAVDALDSSITQIRNVVFALSTSPGEGSVPLRYKLFDLAAEYADALPRTPSISFVGPVDILVKDELANDVLAVAREALTNIAKHAKARTVTLAVSVIGDDIVIDVNDDGVGIGGGTRRSGLANLEKRAVDRGGRLDLTSDSHGTRVHWTARLDSSDHRQ
jgi:signal transduction histidine kinase